MIRIQYDVFVSDFDFHYYHNIANIIGSAMLGWMDTIEQNIDGDEMIRGLILTLGGS